ncbi:hypothetical protein BV25DRAFT_1918952 [Artomyces pyxidatus]|uniref:Uncharacterized protein n=1 Tax=Artomyces pyxidatus TaxID=48021 RepID=A0ACB8SR47_9AGAM|nr:hypothetical protein BV25DRAFT_1918952 [Artomyces pyxidatus]
MPSSQSWFGPSLRVVQRQCDSPASRQTLSDAELHTMPIYTRRGAGQAGYVKGGLSVCVLSDAELEVEDGSEYGAVPKVQPRIMATSGGNVGEMLPIRWSNVVLSYGFAF